MTDLQRTQPSTGGTTPPSAGSPPSGSQSENASGAEAANAAKEEATQVASTAVEQGKQTAGAAVEAGGQVASTAAEGARQVATEAAQQVTEVTKAASTQVRDLAQQAQTQLRDQASAQTERAASGLRDIGQKVRALSEGQSDQAGVAADYARQVADKISDVASRLDERGFDGTVQDLRVFARRRPALFLAGAVATGFVVGRLGRGLQAANQQDSGQSRGSPQAGLQQASPRQLGGPQTGSQQPAGDTVPLAQALAAVGEGQSAGGSTTPNSAPSGDGASTGASGAV